VRDRIKMLIDPGTSFFEIGNLAGFNMMYGDLPAAGVVAGEQNYSNEVSKTLKQRDFYFDLRNWKSQGDLLHDIRKRCNCQGWYILSNKCEKELPNSRNR